MSITKRVLDVLEIVHDDEGRSTKEIAVVASQLPVLVEDWLQHLRTNGHVIERLPPDGGSISRWYCTDRGLATVEWIRSTDGTEEA